MTKINLLPWREELRKQKRQEFFTVLLGTAILGVVLVFAINVFIGNQISNQEGRNQYLNTEIAKLDEKIKEIQNLQTRRNQLIERMKVIQDLQGNRPVIVHLLDELTRTLSDGVYYTKISRTDTKMSLEGMAESNNKISKLMRQLDASPWIGGSSLVSVKNKDEQGQAMNAFVLSVVQEIPKVEKQQESE